MDRKSLFLFAFLIISTDGRKSTDYKLANITCSDILEQRINLKNLLQCCIYCASNPLCEAVNFDDQVCYLHKNLLCCQETQEKIKEVFVHQKIDVQQLKTKQTSKSKIMVFSGSHEQIEILDLDSKMTCLTEFSTFKHGQGGLIDDQTVILCDTSTSGDCIHFGTNEFNFKSTSFKIQLRTYDAIGNVQFLIRFMTVLYTRWRLNRNHG